MTTDSNCACRSLAMEPLKTDPEDEAITIDEVQILKFRCRLCGRKINVQYVPADYTVGVGGETISKGYKGKPLLRMT